MAKNSAGVETTDGQGHVAPVIAALTAANSTVGAGTHAPWRPSTDGRKGHRGRFNWSLYGTFTTATVILEKTYDNGATWIAAKDVNGNAASLTAAGSVRIEETERDVAFRARCTVYTTVTSLITRLSQ